MNATHTYTTSSIYMHLSTSSTLAWDGPLTLILTHTHTHSTMAWTTNPQPHPHPHPQYHGMDHPETAHAHCTFAVFMHTNGQTPIAITHMWRCIYLLQLAAG